MCLSCAVTSTLYSYKGNLKCSADIHSNGSFRDHKNSDYHYSPLVPLLPPLRPAYSTPMDNARRIIGLQGWTGTVTVTTVVPGQTTVLYPTATIAVPTPCTTCQPETLYDTSVFTTNVSTTFVTTSSVRPYGTVSTQYITKCNTDANGNCVNYTTSTNVYTIDYFYGRNITTTVTKVVPVTSTKTIPTATISTPCVTKRADEIDSSEKRKIEDIGLLEREEELEKRGDAGRTFQVAPKVGVAIMGFLLASLTAF
ncbi:hypothetical protein CPB86DRAFT_821556 [Serendipita vermifera]|nr:hypothetical protein CPB86DRAFT_821556 [Serendipita vermifera]